MKNVENKIELPANYVPLEILDICSNKIMGGGHLLGINNYPPLLIGSGPTPIIWLNARTPKGDWVPLIVENLSYHKLIIVETNLKGKKTIIKVNDTILLSSKMSYEDECIVDKLDFRPIGFNLFGNTEKLNIGGSQFIKNTFQGMNFMVGHID